jgi:mono/diheme cytochrome c family protein
LPGGGPLTSQEVDHIIAWLWRERLPVEEVAATARAEKEAQMAANPSKSEGQVLFEIHCARCHTPRWPGRGPATLPNGGGTVELIPGPAGSGRYGPALNKTSLERLFPDIEDQISFIALGAADDVPYGEFARLGNYGMPGFGKILTEDEIRAISMYERSLDPVEQSTVEFAELYAPGGDS